MNVVSLSFEDKIAYGVYLNLRRIIPDVNIEVLRQISVYIARSGLINDIDLIDYKYDEDKMRLIVGNSFIEFSCDKDNLSFSIKRCNDCCDVDTIVKLDNGVNIYSKIKTLDNGMYIVRYNISDDIDEYGVINYYSKKQLDLISLVSDNSLNYELDILCDDCVVYPFADYYYFEVDKQTDIHLDSYDGCVSNALIRIDLLYDNINAVSKNKVMVLER